MFMVMSSRLLKPLEEQETYTCVDASIVLLRNNNYKLMLYEF